MNKQQSSSTTSTVRPQTPKLKKKKTKQNIVSRFAYAKNTKRNVSKYMKTTMSNRNRPKMNENLILENTVNVLPDDMISWHFERIFALGMGGMRDYVLRNTFDNVPMKHIASGAYGDVYSAKVTKEFRAALKKTYDNPRTYNKILTCLPRTGGEVVIKIDKMIAESSNLSWNNVPKNVFYLWMDEHREETRVYLKRVKKEATIGHFLYTFKGPRGHQGRQFFPKVYASFTDPECGLAITVMEHIKGVPMKMYMDKKKAKNQPVPYKVLDQLTRAIETMWLAGFVHSDMHLKNAMVTDNEDVKILDFGFARLIPEKTHQKVKQMIQNGEHIENIWQTSGIGGWSNRNMATRGYSWYNPNIYSARVLATNKRSNTKRLVSRHG